MAKLALIAAPTPPTFWRAKVNGLAKLHSAAFIHMVVHQDRAKDRAAVRRHIGASPDDAKIKKIIASTRRCAFFDLLDKARFLLRKI